MTKRKNAKQLCAERGGVYQHRTIKHGPRCKIPSSEPIENDAITKQARKLALLWYKVAKPRGVSLAAFIEKRGIKGRLYHAVVDEVFKLKW